MFYKILKLHIFLILILACSLHLIQVRLLISPGGCTCGFSKGADFDDWSDIGSLG